MMTLNDAIKHAEDMAELNEAECYECAEEHRQLASWLKELKKLRRGKRPCGWWKFDGMAGNYHSFYICSLCGYSGNKTWNFCPECGAPMNEEARRKYNGLKEGD